MTSLKPGFPSAPLFPKQASTIRDDAYQSPSQTDDGVAIAATYVPQTAGILIENPGPDVPTTGRELQSTATQPPPPGTTVRGGLLGERSKPYPPVPSSTATDKDDLDGPRHNGSQELVGFENVPHEPFVESLGSGIIQEPIPPGHTSKIVDAYIGYGQNDVGLLSAGSACTLGAYFERLIVSGLDASFPVDLARSAGSVLGKSRPTDVFEKPRFEATFLENRAEESSGPSVAASASTSITLQASSSQRMISSDFEMSETHAAAVAALQMQALLNPLTVIEARAGGPTGDYGPICIDTSAYVTQGVYSVLAETEQNCRQLGYLRKAGFGRDPGVIVCPGEKYYVCGTDKMGGYSSILLGINSKGKLVVFKQLVNHKVAAEIKENNAELRASGSDMRLVEIKGTSREAAARETVLTLLLGRILNSGKLIETTDGCFHLPMDFFPVSGREALARATNKKAAARYLFSQAAQRLAELHELGFAHRDVKLSNFQVRPDKTGMAITISDFGLTIGSIDVDHICGTYLSPDLRKKNAHQWQQTDDFALGVSLLMESIPKNHRGSFSPFRISKEPEDIAEDFFAFEDYLAFQRGEGDLPSQKAREMNYMFSFLKKQDPELHWLVSQKLMTTNGPNLTSAQLAFEIEALCANDPNRDADIQQMQKDMFPEAEAKFIEEVVARLKELQLIESKSNPGALE